jgi:endonuclease/exonuclease/phosphatase family metal-dependent hydrolase
MPFSFRRSAGAVFLIAAWAFTGLPQARADNPHVVTVMTRNVDAGTDMNYVLAATDEQSLAIGMHLTIEELNASGFAQRAAKLADEIAAQQPDLIALQEVTLWRTGPIMQPPATNVLCDQLDLLMAELSKRKLHYGIAAIQSLMDVEAPAPIEGIDLRITDRDVILVRLDLPHSQFDVSNAQTHRYQAAFHFGSDLLGELVIQRGWMSVDVTTMKSKFRFVNTHLEQAYPGLPNGQETQAAQVQELLGTLASAGMPIILAGDFNANAEPGNEHTGAVETIVAAGYTDTWKWANPADPGFTWPLFGEDQNSGSTIANERIDLIFTAGNIQRSFGQDPNVISVVRTGTSAPWASDHAGVVLRLRVQ